MQLKLVRGFPEPVAKLGRQLNRLLLEKAWRCLPHSPFFYLMTSSSFQKFKILGIVLHYQGSGLRKDRIRKKENGGCFYSSSSQSSQSQSSQSSSSSIREMSIFILKNQQTITLHAYMFCSRFWLSLKPKFP